MISGGVTAGVPCGKVRVCGIAGFGKGATAAGLEMVGYLDCPGICRSSDGPGMGLFVDASGMGQLSHILHIDSLAKGRLK